MRWKWPDHSLANNKEVIPPLCYFSPIKEIFNECGEPNKAFSAELQTLSIFCGE
jgi:hypothetical protein